MDASDRIINPPLQLTPFYSEAIIVSVFTSRRKTVNLPIAGESQSGLSNPARNGGFEKSKLVLKTFGTSNSVLSRH